MRPIKFRAWDKDSNRMWTDPSVNDESLSDKSLVWMQYTGLKDKNGKEIYEGDIVKTGDETGEVQYDEEQGSYIILFYPNNAKQKSGCAELGSTHPSPIKEIIGQKYELLRV